MNAPSAENDAPQECVYEFHIRGETNNAYCETHRMWRDESEDSFDPNPEHEALLTRVIPPEGGAA